MRDAIIIAGLFLCLCAARLAAQERQNDYALSGEAAFAAICGLSEDDEGLDWAGALYGSDTSLELALDARFPGLRAYFSTKAHVLTGQAVALRLAANGDHFLAASSDGESAFELSIERAYLRWPVGSLVLTLGRQVVNWGAALLWSPADIFADVEVSGLSTERIGTDAIRLTLPLGTLWGLEGVAAPSLRLDSGRYGGRLYGGSSGMDFGLEAAWDGESERATLAFNVKADVIVGLWTEAAWTWMEGGETKALDGLEATIGADWSLASTLFVEAEYRYNGDGVSSQAEALAATAAGEDYPGTHYVYAAVNVASGDLALVGGAVRIDLGNGIASYTVLAALDVAEGASLSLWGSYANGVLSTLGGDDSTSLGLSLRLAF